MSYQNSLLFKYLDTFPRPPGIPEWPDADSRADASPTSTSASRRGATMYGTPDDVMRVACGVRGRGRRSGGVRAVVEHDAARHRDRDDRAVRPRSAARVRPRSGAPHDASARGADRSGYPLKVSTPRATRPGVHRVDDRVEVGERRGRRHQLVEQQPPVEIERRDHREVGVRTRGAVAAADDAAVDLREPGDDGRDLRARRAVRRPRPRCHPSRASRSRCRAPRARPCTRTPSRRRRRSGCRARGTSRAPPRPCRRPPMHEVGRAERARERFLRRVRVDRDDARRADEPQRLHDVETDAADTEDRPRSRRSSRARG